MPDELVKVCARDDGVLALVQDPGVLLELESVEETLDEAESARKELVQPRFIQAECPDGGRNGIQYVQRRLDLLFDGIIEGVGEFVLLKYSQGSRLVVNEREHDVDSYRMRDTKQSDVTVKQVDARICPTYTAPDSVDQRPSCAA